MSRRKANMDKKQYDIHRKRIWNKILNEEKLNKEVSIILKFNGSEHKFLYNTIVWYRKHNGTISQDEFLKQIIFDHPLFKEYKEELNQSEK